jgi:hypothetical protein
MMEQQIRLVDGGVARLMRAARARWRARNQRERWIADDAAMAAVIYEYDQHLLEEWEDKFGPMCDDCAILGSDEHKKAGLTLLDWAHSHAPLELRPIEEGWESNYLVQGSYQQLAEELTVGWHPKYRELLVPDGDTQKND